MRWLSELERGGNMHNCLKHKEDMLACLAWFSVKPRIGSKARWLGQICGLRSPIWKTNKTEKCGPLFLSPWEDLRFLEKRSPALNGILIPWLFPKVRVLHFMSGRSESLCFEQSIVVLWVFVLLKLVCVCVWEREREREREGRNNSLIACTKSSYAGAMGVGISQSLSPPEVITVCISASL